MTLDSTLKERIALAPGYTYLNTAQCGLLMKPVAEEMAAVHQEQAQYGCAPWMQWLERREAVREHVAQLLSANASEISFVSSTSHGMSTLAFMLYQEGKRKVLSTDAEFVSTVLPWRHYGFEVELAPTQEGVLDPETVKARLDHADVFVTGHVHSYTGFRNDLRTLGELCQKSGTLFAVNATQSAGVFPIDVEKDAIDFLTFSGFKWLMAGYGTGALYIKTDKIRNRKGPLTGWMALENPYTHDLESYVAAQDGRALEHGAPDFARVFALDRALSEFESIDYDALRRRVLSLAEKVREESRSRSITMFGSDLEAHQSGIVSLRLPEAPRLAKELRERKIIASAREGILRVATHFFNTEEDIATFFHHLDELRLAH